MLRVIIRLIILCIFIALSCLIPYGINYYAQKNLIPRVLEYSQLKDHIATDIKAQNIAYAFPFGLKAQDFSFDLTIKPESLHAKKLFISGDATGITLSNVLNVLNKEVSFNLFMDGTVIISHKDELKEIHAQRAEATTDLAQIIVRKAYIPFTCNFDQIKLSNITKSLISCFKEYYASREIELQEVFYDINIDAQKRLISVNNITENGAHINENSLAELQSIYRNSLDQAQIKLVQKYPLYLLQVFMIKKIAEDKTRALDVNLRNPRLNYGSSYFYFLLSKQYGPQIVNEVIQMYTQSGEAGLKENLSSAILGKLSHEKNVSSEEFLDPEYLEKFTNNLQ